MVVFANVVGLMAVALFVLSYQFKNRRGIILCNASSRVLYVAQYFLLGAPFWLVYNLLNGAYGSAVGNVITLVSITIALVRNYSAKHKKQHNGVTIAYVCHVLQILFFFVKDKNPSHCAWIFLVQTIQVPNGYKKKRTN